MWVRVPNLKHNAVQQLTFHTPIIGINCIPVCMPPRLRYVTVLNNRRNSQHLKIANVRSIRHFTSSFILNEHRILACQGPACSRHPNSKCVSVHRIKENNLCLQFLAHCVERKADFTSA